MDDEDDATNNANGERPSDIVIIHRISDAPTTVTAFDVTMALPDSLHEGYPDGSRTEGEESTKSRRTWSWI